MTSIRRAAVALAFTLLGLSVFPAGGRAGTLDQSVVADTGLAVVPGLLAQTFTAGLTGDLDQVDLLL